MKLTWLMLFSSTVGVIDVNKDRKKYILSDVLILIGDHIGFRINGFQIAEKEKS